MPLKPEKDERKPWIHFPASDYEDCVGGMGHLFSKPIHTNALQVCIRMSNPPKPLPYVAISTLGSKAIPLEFSGRTSLQKEGGQLLAALENQVELRYVGATAESIAEAESMRAACELPLSSGTEVVDARLRQIFMPTGDTYIAITPLHSAGFSMLVNESVKREKEKGLESGAKYGYRKTAHLKIGGSRPNNVGLRTNALHWLLVFAGPVSQQKTKLAYAYHFRGITLTPSVTLIMQYKAWLQAQKKSQKDEDGKFSHKLTSTQKLRSQEVEHLTKMVMQVLLVAKNARELLLSQEFSPMLAEDVAEPVVALLDSSCRYPGWELEVASGILQGIARTESKSRSEGTRHIAKLDDFALSSYQSLVADLIRKEA